MGFHEQVQGFALDEIRDSVYISAEWKAGCVSTDSCKWTDMGVE